MPEPVRVPLPAGAPRLAVLGTAYALSTRAHALVRTQNGAPLIELWPRAGRDAKGLIEEALRVFANQCLRGAVAERGAAVRAELTRRMVELARRAGRPAEAALSPEAAARLAAVLAEKGTAEKDPLGIKTPWSQLRRPK
ncbi:MAG: hypothetical protein HYZ75_06940 [Elusimicrobia bacterium]|nr:hypothetical protein [Elusimicrobiota bacterium]